MGRLGDVKPFCAQIASFLCMQFVIIGNRYMEWDTYSIPTPSYCKDPKA
jgi:hypothetical protein